MKRNAPFAPYVGDAPYLFVSYAHKNDEEVFAVMAALHAQRYRIWYDEGIETGADWPQRVAERLAQSSLVVVFVSEAALASQNCVREINYAVAQKKDMLVVRLDETELPEGVGMQLSVVPQVRFASSEQTADDLAALLDASLVGDGVSGYERAEANGKHQANRWFIVAVAAIAALVIAVAALVAALTGALPGVGLSRETVETEGGEVSITTFSDPVSLQVMLGTLDTRYIYVCGDRFVSDPSVIGRVSGAWTVQGEQVKQGSVDSLSPFANMDLLQLAIVDEQVESLKGIESLAALTYLDLSGNPVGDLRALTSLGNLQTLRLVDIPATTDLSCLAEMGSLREVAVSRDRLDDVSFLLDRDVDVVVRG